MKSEFFNPNSKPSYALMSTISGHANYNRYTYKNRRSPTLNQRHSASANRTVTPTEAYTSTNLLLVYHTRSTFRKLQRFKQRFATLPHLELLHGETKVTVYKSTMTSDQLRTNLRRLNDGIVNKLTYWTTPRATPLIRLFILFRPSRHV